MELLSVYNWLLCHQHDGEVSEWSNVRSWKDRVPHKGTEGSNPSLSDLSQAREAALIVVFLLYLLGIFNVSRLQ